MNILFILLIALLPQQVEKKAPQLIKSIATQADIMSSDHMGNVYLAHKNTLWMYNSLGDSLRSYNTKQYGDISFIDATNPYKILVFHKDYGILQFLDNFLSQNAAPINLQELGFDMAQLACHSRENGFWVYDWTEQKVVRMDNNLRVTHQTVNLRQWFGNAFQPNFMLEYNQQVYLNEPSRGILIFDQFATYIKTIPLLGLNSPQIMEKSIYYHKNNQFCNYVLKSLELNCVDFASGEILDMHIQKNRLYLLEKGKLNIYLLN